MNLWNEPVVIVGAGPTGLGAASRLQEIGADWLLLERRPHVGGLAASFRSRGFTWDIGGHVIFSHYPDYDRLLDTVLERGEWLWHERVARIRMCGRWVPYPLQYNIWALPPDEMWACLSGVIRLYAQRIEPDRSDFQRFIDTHFGEGLASLFMNPYNWKVWAFRPGALSADWIGERVAQVDLERLAWNVVNRKTDDSWGPNNTFRFPLRGGTGEVWRRLAWTLPVERLLLETEVVALSARDRTLTTSDGRRFGYGSLISTMPLDRLVAMSDLDDLREIAAGLRHSSVHVVGLGMKGRPPDEIRTHCWMYFPEDHCPFYRATLFSNYSPHNVPDGAWSLLLETSESAEKPVDQGRIVEECIGGAVASGILGSSSQVVHTWHMRVEYGYPTPTRDRDERLEVLLPALERRGIFSRGRFGAWQYEVGNMDHSYMQGREVADRVGLGGEETVLRVGLSREALSGERV